MFKSILCYPCSYLTSLHSTTNTQDTKMNINNMYGHDSILNKIHKEQMVLFNKRNFGLNTSQFIYNFFYDKMKKTDEEDIPIKSRDELLDSLVNSKISLNEID
jgi:hypothetical protein